MILGRVINRDVAARLTMSLSISQLTCCGCFTGTRRIQNIAATKRPTRTVKDSTGNRCAATTTTRRHQQALFVFFMPWMERLRAAVASKLCQTVLFSETVNVQRTGPARRSAYLAARPPLCLYRGSLFFTFARA